MYITQKNRTFEDDIYSRFLCLEEPQIFEFGYEPFELRSDDL